MTNEPDPNQFHFRTASEMSASHGVRAKEHAIKIETDLDVLFDDDDPLAPALYAMDILTFLGTTAQALEDTGENSAIGVAVSIRAIQQGLMGVVNDAVIEEHRRRGLEPPAWMIAMQAAYEQYETHLRDLYERQEDPDGS